MVGRDNDRTASPPPHRTASPPPPPQRPRGNHVTGVWSCAAAASHHLEQPRQQLGLPAGRVELARLQRRPQLHHLHPLHLSDVERTHCAADGAVRRA
eukprot:1211849-Prymnesium_polylepis.1